jgi:hypothetical protein
MWGPAVFVFGAERSCVVGTDCAEKDNAEVAERERECRGYLRLCGHGAQQCCAPTDTERT